MGIDFIDLSFVFVHTNAAIITFTILCSTRIFTHFILVRLQNNILQKQPIFAQRVTLLMTSYIHI